MVSAMGSLVEGNYNNVPILMCYWVVDVKMLHIAPFKMVNNEVQK